MSNLNRNQKDNQAIEIFRSKVFDIFDLIYLISTCDSLFRFISIEPAIKGEKIIKLNSKIAAMKNMIMW